MGRSRVNLRDLVFGAAPTRQYAFGAGINRLALRRNACRGFRKFIDLLPDRLQLYKCVTRLGLDARIVHFHLVRWFAIPVFRGYLHLVTGFADLMSRSDPRFFPTQLGAVRGRFPASPDRATLRRAPAL